MIIASLISVFSLLFSASAVFGELQDALNLIWHAPQSQEKQIFVYAKERFFSFIMVLGSGIVLLALTLVSAGLTAASGYFYDIPPLAFIVTRLLNFAVSFGVISFLFAVLFKTIPQIEIPWRSVWPAAFFTALLFIVGKELIGFYLGHTGLSSSYGAAGSIVILLVWIYYSSQILFFGAEFAYVYSSHFHLHGKNNALENGENKS